MMLQNSEMCGQVGSLPLWLGFIANTAADESKISAKTTPQNLKTTIIPQFLLV